MSNNKQTTGYICPKTTKQCDDECCVSADECHIEAWEKVVTTEEMTWDEYGNPIVINDEQAMIDYNAMEEEWEMDNYNEMKDE